MIAFTLTKIRFLFWKVLKSDTLFKFRVKD